MTWWSAVEISIWTILVHDNRVVVEVVGVVLELLADIQAHADVCVPVMTARAVSVQSHIIMQMCPV